MEDFAVICETWWLFCIALAVHRPIPPANILRASAMLFMLHWQKQSFEETKFEDHNEMLIQIELYKMRLILAGALAYNV